MFSSQAPRGLRASGSTPSARGLRPQRAMWGATPVGAAAGRRRPVAARRGQLQVKRRLRLAPRRSAYQRLVAAARGGAKYQFRRGRLRAPWRRVAVAERLGRLVRRRRRPGAAVALGRVVLALRLARHSQSSASRSKNWESKYYKNLIRSGARLRDLAQALTRRVVRRNA